MLWFAAIDERNPNGNVGSHLENSGLDLRVGQVPVALLFGGSLFPAKVELNYRMLALDANAARTSSGSSVEKLLSNATARYR